MRKQVRTIAPTETVALAKELFRRYDIHHLAVTDGKQLVGMLGDRDLFNVTDDAIVRDVMIQQPITISPDETVRKAAGLMTGHVIGSLPVLEEGKLVGIVTSYDLLDLLAKGASRPAPAAERPILAKRSPKRRPAITR